jgi:hypothetical protein
MYKTKYLALLFLILLATAMFSVAFVAAQDEPIEEIPTDQFPSVPNPNVTPSPAATGETANVVVASSLGGSTTPAPGSYVYAYAATIEIKATANSGYKFLYWIIKGAYAPGHNQPPINYPQNSEDPEFVPSFPAASQVVDNSLITSTNPLKIICGYGYTFVYQPVFVPTTPPAVTSDAIVKVVDSIGGTTNPGSGTYNYANGTTIHLEATPSSDYSFQYWVAVGEDGHATVISDNPTNIICGYGYTYTYQPMFAPKGTSTTSSSTNEMYFYVIIAVLAIVAVVGLVMAVMYRGKAKK